ncbi:hypothetical protein [Roseivirga sp.]|uniref:hypothetical protein n=1 Tax=Roseivirga sp. TaxID=1964215 RepID=UPI003B51FA5F
MIDDHLKLIFVENPKTGTYSIRKALLGENIHNPLDPRVATFNHEVPEKIRNKHPEKWRDYLSFVVIRNTWDRAYSFFNFYRNIAQSESYKSLSFDEWVAADCPPPREDHLRGPMHREGRFDDVLCQQRYAHDVNQVIVLHSFDVEKRNLELQLGVGRILSRLNRQAAQIPVDSGHHRNPDCTMVWKKETVNKLKNKYAEEIERFGFEKPVD